MKIRFWQILGLLLAFGFFAAARIIQTNQDKPLEIPAQTTVPTLSVTATSIEEEATAVPQVIPTQEILPTVTPTEILNPLVDGYRLAGGVIDLSYGSIAMAIVKSDGSELRGTWANAVWDTEGQPQYSIVYSHLTDQYSTVVMVPHTGYLTNKENPLQPYRLYAEVLDNFLRVTDGKHISFDEGLVKIQGLKDATIYFCQTDKPMAPYSDFTQDCSGEGYRKLYFIVKDMALITAEQTIPWEDGTQYDYALADDPRVPNTGAINWLNANGFGFEFFSKSNQILLSTCVEQYPGQDDVSGVKSYSYNRAVFALEVVQP